MTLLFVILPLSNFLTACKILTALGNMGPNMPYQTLTQFIFFLTQLIIYEEKKGLSEAIKNNFEKLCLTD